jgi:hypothetical protein
MKKCYQTYCCQLFSIIMKLPLCVGNRWKCANGHEWVTAHCDTAWFTMPTTCPECGQIATSHRGEWRTIEDYFNNAIGGNHRQG